MSKFPDNTLIINWLYLNTKRKVNEISQLKSHFIYWLQICLRYAHWYTGLKKRIGPVPIKSHRHRNNQCFSSLSSDWLWHCRTASY